MKNFLTKVKPFVPSIIMLSIIIISLITVFSFGIDTHSNMSKDPNAVYIENKTSRNNMLITSIICDVIVLAFYILEIRFRKTILKWILFNVSFILMIASNFILGMSFISTTCDSLLIMIGIPFFNFFLFIISFVCACLFLKQYKKD